MKICLFHLKEYAVFKPESGVPIGGTLVQLHVLAVKLLQEGHKVSFITGDYGQPDIEIFDGIMVYKSTKVERTLLNLLLAPFFIWKSLKRVDADVYISSSAGAETGIIAFYCKLHNKRFIYRVAHDMDCNGKFINENGLVGKLFEYGLRSAKVVVAQTNDQINMLRKIQINPALLIANSFVIAINQKLEKKSEYILWVARCEKWKRPDLAIKIAASLPNFKFIIICPLQKFQEALFAEIKTESAKFPNIQFINFVSPEIIHSYFEQAKIFIGTSEHEGYPNTYLQACMAHTPIVSYRVNPDKSLTEHNFGFVADDNLDEMIKQIQALMTAKLLWHNMSEASFEYVTKHHNIDINISLWNSILN